MSENSPVGTTVATLTATTGATSVDSYTVTGTPSNVVEIATSTSGEVTLKALVDYEANTELVLLIIATDDTSATGTATVTVSIGDVAGPPFTTTTKELCVADGLGPGESVGDVSVSVTGSVVTYADSDATFDVDSATGAVTTASGITLDKATAAEHTVTITGTVTGGESNDLTLTVKVGGCSGKEKMAAALGSLLLSLLAYTILSL
ncbi:protocadherin Fat 4-like isoform X2 [Mya arenaria]|nr:protocadherin Fat 4-like isoform X2 [Mya arenaria]